ncbi:LysR family transcriptional regulator [Oceanibacterium hippocampi]|uniref:HTH-type transcriptional regulator CynR n=1 Tax=Oceanibacterium hippocampi TaxID=745714 RepID=A0A1Y5TSP2_9PROT|nr:LysR family transcriptional regulator [Oceanibacterium hippocampi]SLN67112.1 HTH-type transcriptional regulator CynR [Oceanibacterium hippocampi]
MAIGLRKLRHVVETARFESVTRAADALLITQSALTRSIAEVEAELGIQLFVRLPRGVRTTEAGRSFVEKALRIIGDVNSLVSGVEDYRNLRSGRLRLGVAPAGYQRFVSEAVASLAGENPSLAVEVTTGSSETLAPRLTSGEFDAIVGHARLLGRWPDLEVTDMADFYLAMMVRKGHPLSVNTKLLEADVLKFPLLLPSTIEPLQNGIALRCARNGLPPPNPQYVFDDFELVSAIIDRTDAYTPVISLNPSFGRLRERFLLIQDVVELPSQHLGFAVSRTRSQSPAAIAMMEKLKATLGTRQS